LTGPHAGEVLGVRRATGRPLAAYGGLFLVGVLTSTCSSSKPSPTPTHAPELWGDLKPVVSVKELMRDMIDPASDNIFDAVGTVVTKLGVVDIAPKTDADWEKLRIGAVTLAEGIYLLKIPRPFTPPGDENNSTGPDAPELTPAQIKAKLEADPVEWNARIEAVRNVGLEVLDIVKRKDIKELWDASDNLDAACESCHKSYWYPGENAEFYRKLDRRLLELPRTNSPTLRQ
jgi:cytochrome c556